MWFNLNLTITVNNLPLLFIPAIKMKKFGLILLLIFTILCKNKSVAQNYDSLFAAREKILLAGVDYHRAVVKWNFFNLAQSRFDVSGELKMNLNFSWTARVLYDFNPDKGGFSGEGGIRYYYNLEDRITKHWLKREQKTSCFSADYFEADYSLGWNYGPWNTNPFEDGDELPPGIITGPTLKMGTQRKIRRHFFYDAYAGYNLVLNYKGRVVVGLAIGLEIL
jgi:hypothetical protein